MEKRISKIKVFVFIPTEPPREYLEKWRDSMKNAGTKMGEGINQAISGIGDYARKMANPAIQSAINWINPNYRTKRGRSYREVIENMIANIPDGYNKFKGRIESAFETVDGEEAKRFSEEIDGKAYRGMLRTAQQCLPFSGYKNQIRGVSPFAARWLTGDSKVKMLITREDKEIIGEPILITQPEIAGRFRNTLIQRLNQAGAQIVRAGFGESVIKEENDLTNELVNQFLSDAFAKFGTGGESCLDYIVENGQLFLSVKVSQI